MAHDFHYDDDGSVSLYFFLTLAGMIVLAFTVFVLRKRKRIITNLIHCQCCLCNEKNNILRKKSNIYTSLLLQLLVILCWIVFLALFYKIFSRKILQTNLFDPFAILELDSSSTNEQIRKRYLELSKKFHPDHSGDSDYFIKIIKAYKALSDEKARENYEKFGNPDGPSASHYGIALPSWLVDKKYSKFVLLIYGFCLLIILPSVVIIWWKKSSMFAKDGILADTVCLFQYFTMKTPDMNFKRMVKILCASFEFEKSHNKNVSESPIDNVEIPKLMKELGTYSESLNEKPFCLAYSVKARTLLLAYFERIPLNGSLKKDLNLILSHCPKLLNELLNTICAFITLGFQRSIQIYPKIDTLEMCITLMAQVAQAQMFGQSLFYQLPHMNESILKKIRGKPSLQTINDFYHLDNSDHKIILKTLNDNEFLDVIEVAGYMPSLEIDCHIIIDDEDDIADDQQSFFAESILKLKVNINRHSNMNFKSMKIENIENAFEKNILNKKKKNKKYKNIKNPENSSSNTATNILKFEKSEPDLISRKKVNLKEIKSPFIHAPFFPDGIHETWYAYVIWIGKDTTELVAGPTKITNLIDHCSLDFSFHLAESPGLYKYKTIIKSASYIDLFFEMFFQVSVCKSKVIDPGVQWQFSDDGDDDVDEITDDESKSIENDH